MNQVKFTQIATGQDLVGLVIYALDTKGGLWVSRDSSGKGWDRAEMPEEESEGIQRIEPHKPISRQY